MQIGYWASQHASDVIASAGRTEDVRFSPSGRRLALALFNNHALAVFDICHEQKRIGLTSAVQISSPYIEQPHGIDFIDEETIVVANRGGHVAIFRLPPFGSNLQEAELLHVIRSGDASLVSTPGSVAVSRKKDGLLEALICNNYVHYVTRHSIDSRDGWSVRSSEVLLKEWLRVPDGISVSSDARWIAISSHDMHTAFVYENTPLLNERSNPDGILRAICYPHGLRFTSDGRFILLADAGAPYIRIYGRNGEGWRGIHNPLLSFRVMDDEVFFRGRHSPADGGPKGLDVDNDQGLLVTTCEQQPLAFFDVDRILERVAFNSTAAEIHPHLVASGVADDGYFQRLSDARYELELYNSLCQAEARALRAEKQAARAEARYGTLVRSLSWRFTAPARALSHFLRTPGKRVKKLKKRNALAGN